MNQQFKIMDKVTNSTEKVSVLNFYYSRLSAEEKSALNKKLNIKSRTTRWKMMGDPMILTVRQAIDTCEFLSDVYGLFIGIPDMERDISDFQTNGSYSICSCQKQTPKNQKS
jgi:hypothetical protein